MGGTSWDARSTDGWPRFGHVTVSQTHLPGGPSLVHLAGGTSLDVRLGLTGGTDSGYRFSRKVGTSLKFARGQLTGGTSLYVRLGLTGGTDSREFDRRQAQI